MWAWKQRTFPKGISRGIANWRRQIFQRISRRDIRSCLEDLDLPADAWICIHARLSSLGFLVDGPASIFEAMLEAVSGSTIIMPSFPFSGSMLDYVRTNPTYDPRKTPSMSGLLSEVLRRVPETRRSLHPTHPCIALGPDAGRIVDGSEGSETPFGPQSSYGTYASAPNAWQLLIDTNHTSIAHWFQEQVRMPNLFVEEVVELAGLDWEGRPHRYRVQVHRPAIPLYMVVGKPGLGAEYLRWRDYALPFPATASRRLEQRLRRDSFGPVLDRTRKLAAMGVIRTTRLGKAELAAIQVAPWARQICEDANASFSQWSRAYELHRMQQAQREGRFISSN